jgi:hypothetical protein
MLPPGRVARLRDHLPLALLGGVLTLGGGHPLGLSEAAARTRADAEVVEAEVELLEYPMALF